VQKGVGTLNVGVDVDAGELAHLMQVALGVLVVEVAAGRMGGSGGDW